MNHLLLDVTENVAPITRQFTNTDWDGILRDVSLYIMRLYCASQVLGEHIPHNPAAHLKDIQWRYGFDPNDGSVSVEFVKLYKCLSDTIGLYVTQTNPTKLLTVVRVSTANNIFQLHLGYA
ncbi:hypothetical protein FDJ23_gp115 [Erwinia phage vB_EamM_Desertfox]|uniref:Uncharacterized protein n=5 Tax=Agricanvirus TaxID=1984776 RepID=A0A482IIM0_9CAUD|nr:hypothetical protein FDH97_gp120 [Erwinia phage vB_EamM_Deimos-Minion]YP_009621856.1 hypothetical protein FDJ23_gp115 [Erwinia phage vB_EamM_Desertfox]AUG85903.1 hypothetical protein BOSOLAPHORUS_116 [Erwinia phage vB_EamM_Bosolaphorus]AUG86544.1 hypothetical protein MADMEL_116 [Erwinia phage vB_EamM_MadMel]QBP07223.1 hypothetical protein REBECCA_116 [Erwinia phage Rebecca]ANH52218.1 hypothetical protein DM_120 [Erwinia phage vB_EamM_Deimos-Minion]AUG86222.1 hypothetical protein DESERTFOX_